MTLNFSSPSIAAGHNQVKVRSDAGKESEKQCLRELYEGETRTEQGKAMPEKVVEGVPSRAAELG